MKIPNPKPCDCGADVEIIEIDGLNPWWRVACPDCGREGASEPTIRQAVEWWNIRDD